MRGKPIIPKGCFVHRVELVRGKAIVGYRCADDRGQHYYQHKGGAVGNYPERVIRGIRRIDFRGMSVSGAGRMGFVLSPAHAVCRKDHDTLVCSLKGDTSSESLRGARRRRSR